MTTGRKSPGRPRTKPAEQRREDLMDSAQRLFLDQGFAATTIERIALTAGVAKGTFYLYFHSKDDVRAALGERFARRHLAHMREAVEAHSGPDGAAMLGAWAEATVAFYLDSLAVHDMLFFEAGVPTREGLVDTLVTDHLTGLLPGPETEARALAVFLFSGVHALVDDAILREKTVDRDSLARRAKQLCLRAAGL